MTRTSPVWLLAALAACATSPGSIDHHWTRPGFSSALPPAAPEVPAADGDGAPQEAMLPVGIGLTTGPTSTLLGATLDLPLDKKMTIGPSLQYGFDSDVDVFSLGLQLKYFLPLESNESGSFAVLPYVTGGVGVTSIDKDGRSGDSGLYFDAGVGVRYLTGEHYRIGSEARLNLMPDDVAGEHAYMSFEILQVVISF